MGSVLKNKIRNIPTGFKIGGIASIVCLLLTGGICLMENQFQKSLYDQQMASRWSQDKGAAQISCFFAPQAVENAQYFKGVEMEVDKALLEASIVTESENPSARLWMDAVSRVGKVTLTRGKVKVELTAYGVEGDFFRFHPLRLRYGSFFGRDSMMQDGIVIDEETAWQLFGSNDVAGMQVMIGEVPHFITGVIKRESGKMAKAAGLESSVCYLSLESLEKYGQTQAGYNYEIVMPNPIKKFAYSIVSKAVGEENTQVTVVENQSRYELLPLFQVIKDFGTRSMSIKGIVFPYWENIARGYEDILAVTLLLKTILLILPCVVGIAAILYLWKRKTWTAGQCIQRLQDWCYELQVKQKDKSKKEEKK